MTIVIVFIEQVVNRQGMGHRNDRPRPSPTVSAIVKRRLREAVDCIAYFFSTIGSRSILAARMKSFSDSPPMAWVQSSMATLR